MEQDNNTIKVEENDKQTESLIDQNKTVIPNNEILPNQTLYINNLNEKIKVDGKISY